MLGDNTPQARGFLGRVSTGSTGLSVALGSEAPTQAPWADMATCHSAAVPPSGQVGLVK